MSQPDVSEDRLGELAMKYRGTRDPVIRADIAQEYAEVIDGLIRTGSWTSYPGPDEMLPDDDMPDTFYEHWSKQLNRPLRRRVPKNPGSP